MRQEIETKFEQIRSYCIEMDEGTQPYLDNIYSALQGYFNATEGVSKQMCAVIRGMYSFYATDQLKCENDDKVGIKKGTLPSGDINGCWYKWSWLNDSLYSRFEYETTEVDGVSTKMLMAEQPQIDKIIEEIKEARSIEEEKLEAYAEKFWEHGNQNGFIGMIEDRGKVIQTPDKKDIIKKIYVDNGIYDIIKDSGLNVPCPSYYKELC